MRHRLLLLAASLFLSGAGVPKDDDGGVTDETLITAAWIVAAVAFLGFVTLKVVPWIKALDLPVVG